MGNIFIIIYFKCSLLYCFANCYFFNLFRKRLSFIVNDKSDVGGFMHIQARPLFNDRRKFSKLADPRFEGRYPIRGLYQALAVASMCIQEQAATRPLIGDVVTALSYLANQTYDPNSHRGAGDKDDRRNRDGARIFKNDEGGGSGRRWDLEGSEKEDSPRETARILNRDLERERAVAEAKMWGENLREKRRQSAQGSFDGTNG